VTNDLTEEAIMQRMIEANATISSAAQTLSELGLVRNAAFDRLVERGWIQSALFDRDRYFAATNQRLAVGATGRRWIGIAVVVLTIVVLIAMIRLAR
jgi:hypothetical protein